MPDLSAQIRATLDAWAKPAVIETTKVLGPAEYAEFIARWAAAHEGPQQHELVVLPDRGPSPFDRMRDALIAALEITDPANANQYRDCECERVDPERVLLAIAGKLGIEVDDD